MEKIRLLVTNAGLEKLNIMSLIQNFIYQE